MGRQRGLRSSRRKRRRQRGAVPLVNRYCWHRLDLPFPQAVVQPCNPSRWDPLSRWHPSLLSHPTFLTALIAVPVPVRNYRIILFKSLFRLHQSLDQVVWQAITTTHSRYNSTSHRHIIRIFNDRTVLRSNHTISIIITLPVQEGITDHPLITIRSILNNSARKNMRSILTRSIINIINNHRVPTPIILPCRNIMAIIPPWTTKTIPRQPSAARCSQS
jgi:hypothetical protein